MSYDYRLADDLYDAPMSRVWFGYVTSPYIR